MMTDTHLKGGREREREREHVKYWISAALLAGQEMAGLITVNESCDRATRPARLAASFNTEQKPCG